MRASRWRSASGTAGKVAEQLIVQTRRVKWRLGPNSSAYQPRSSTRLRVITKAAFSISIENRVTFLGTALALRGCGGITAIMRYHPLQTTLPALLLSLVAILLSSSITTAQGPRRETPAAAQSHKVTSLTAIEKGHGVITFPIEELEVTSVLVVLRENGTMLLALFSDLQLQADGTWSVSPVSPQEIDLTINGRAVGGEVTGSGKLFLTEDLKSFKRITFKGQTCIGSNITVTFVADAAERARRRSFIALMNEAVTRGRT